MACSCNHCCLGSLDVEREKITLEKFTFDFNKGGDGYQLSYRPVWSAILFVSEKKWSLGSTYS